MTYRFVSISILALSLCLTGCDGSEPNQPSTPPSANDAQAANAAAIQPAGYKSHEGNVYYYETESGELTGVQNLGKFQESPDIYRLIHQGDLGVQLSDGSVAVIAPGSQVDLPLRISSTRR